MSQVRLAQFIRVRGVVQGVGFRPFVYGLASSLGLDGWVRNTSSGVEISLEGSPEALARFRERLQADAPPLAHIEDVLVEDAAADGYQGFAIRDSHAESGHYQLVSPDISICDDCRRELFDPQDRRYRYPFINCTNCGPRFTIIRDIPYDRPATTMAAFRMCRACRAEYEDPGNRRFHAQPNACPVCGPRLTLAMPDGTVLAERDKAIRHARRALLAGQVIALKGLGGFQLACDATSEAIVGLLRLRKRRLDKPLAVMVADLEAASQLAVVSPAEAELLASPQRPIVLLQARPDSPLAPNVAPGIGTVGVMLPYTPLHYLLLQPEEGFAPALVMTSGNLTEEPIAMENDEALRRLGQIADLFLLHNRGIYARYDDSVWFVPGGGPQPVRRARGYAPFPVRLPFRAPQVLACGTELKNTFCLTRDDHAFLSPHIGDMENLETLEHFEHSIDLYKRLFRLDPHIVAYDLHPEYLATKFALETWGDDSEMRLVPVQHHHAHIAACLADNGRTDRAIGVAFDGTGYGTDGEIWGGEFLLADLRGFQRVGRLAEFPLPGAAAAILKPYRIALGLIFTAGLDPSSWPGLATIDPHEVEVIGRQVERGLNTPPTTSAGRLFDAVAALAGVRGEITYEAQAAMELEAAASAVPGPEAAYPLEVRHEAGMWVIDWHPLLEGVLADLRGGVETARIAARFHAWLAQAIVQTAGHIAADTGLRTVALSGGCFQNRLLLAQVQQALEEAGLEVLVHRQVPANDGGVSLGQAAIAAMQGR